ncbi:hypothetical protein BLS_009589 [Venturia inaequalis]|uniref:Uncharacterized protein n=1 Tax=Venturia inaequalis TaxID=5025 RepID=A0A8H3V257_VENIN|nr:hypothetical protein BLS_009589 [Venturia inaequalis]KAE9988374.1 hypothetical protein EG328_011134 [Venturia inaequalis]KAE9991339.1 hypothetical protein EG327_011841 [Venturia inaequalis]
MADADPENEERLKSALWFTIGQIVDHETLAQNHNATPQFIGALTELVWSQISTTPSLSRYDDVLLLARRNEGLEMLLRNFVEEQREKNGTVTKGKGRAGAKKK